MAPGCSDRFETKERFAMTSQYLVLVQAMDDMQKIDSDRHQWQHVQSLSGQQKK